MFFFHAVSVFAEALGAIGPDREEASLLYVSLYQDAVSAYSIWNQQPAAKKTY